MKTIHIFLTIPSLTIATLRNMEQNLKHLESKFSRQRSGGAPSFLQASIAQINHYGCWCFFQDDHHLAKGPPQNEVDKFCKILHNGYECAMIDSGNKNLPACSPWKVDYNSSTMIGNTAQEVETNCVVSNAGYCEQRACIVENFFILNIFSVFFTVRSKMMARLQNSVIFGDFQNNLRPKNRNFQNCPMKRARR